MALRTLQVASQEHSSDIPHQAVWITVSVQQELCTHACVTGTAVGRQQFLRQLIERFACRNDSARYSCQSAHVIPLSARRSSSHTSNTNARCRANSGDAASFVHQAASLVGRTICQKLAGRRYRGNDARQNRDRSVARNRRHRKAPPWGRRLLPRSWHRFEMTNVRRAPRDGRDDLPADRHRECARFAERWCGSWRPQKTLLPVDPRTMAQKDIDSAAAPRR